MLKPNLIFETNQIMVFQQQLGPWDNLNHLFVCKSTKKACIVDPFDGEYWHDFCSSHGFQLSEIWLTHSHWDHVKGVEELVNITSDNIVIRCHILEQERGYKFNGISWWQHQEFTEITQSFGAMDFAIHCTPGHTPGHVTIIGNGLVITGDCLFLGRCGR
ncbi:MAG TPA: MBL fold metallo-hydrolase, partial [Candidatus Poseidoniales archaeon]